MKFLWPSVIIVFVLDYAAKPKAISKWPDWKTCDGKTKMGNGV